MVLRLADSAAPFDLNTQQRTPLRLSKRGLPDVQLYLDGKKEFIEFDSGSGDFFSFRTKDAKRAKRKQAEEKLSFEGVFSFGVGGQKPIVSQRYRVKVDRLELGGTVFTDFYSDSSKPSAPRIGAGVLYYGTVTVDYRNGWFYFAPYPAVKRPSGLATFGFDLAYINDELVVKWVLENSAAEAQGLSFGDRVLAINGQAVEALPALCETYLNGFAFEASDTVTIEIQDAAGRRQTHTLQKESY
jgi:hypothetical protein